jgi:GR25 family glycosyltransferase involved in LPS biosynthesis
MDHIGGVFYINLDSRTDRRTEIEEELTRMGISGERFPAIKDDIGIVGCGKSHLTVLKEARERGLKNVLIFEDDFQFIVSKEEFWDMLNRFFTDTIQGNMFDVLMLGYNMLSSQKIDNLLMKVISAQTTSGYIVNERFYDSLINIWEIALPLLLSSGDRWMYSLDATWKQLQPDTNWYAFVKRVGIQRPNFSDIALLYVDYKC